MQPGPKLKRRKLKKKGSVWKLEVSVKTRNSERQTSKFKGSQSLWHLRLTLKLNSNCCYTARRLITDLSWQLPGSRNEPAGLLNVSVAVTIYRVPDRPSMGMTYACDTGSCECRKTSPKARHLMLIRYQTNQEDKNNKGAGLRFQLLP